MLAALVVPQEACTPLSSMSCLSSPTWGGHLLTGVCGIGQGHPAGPSPPASLELQDHQLLPPPFSLSQATLSTSPPVGGTEHLSLEISVPQILLGPHPGVRSEGLACRGIAGPETARLLYL